MRAIGATDDRVRCIRRIGRRGLAGACIEGMLSSQARYVAVIDADLQHDETLLAAMLERCARATSMSWSQAATSPAARPTALPASARFMSRLSHVAAY